MASVNSVFSFKVLSAITAAVLAVHLAALQASPTLLRPHQGESVLHTFLTRSIEPAPAPGTPPVADSAAATRLPEQRARPGQRGFPRRRRHLNPGKAP